CMCKFILQCSLTQLFRLVQAGEEVPGLSKLDIKPNSQTPTPSQMERRPKPWENSKTHITLEFLVCSSSAWWQCLCPRDLCWWSFRSSGMWGAG
uniref:Peroxisomal membrane protein PEX14-like KPWE domain-containing protein n=1 Tax=Hucho hucho TaxID=62062 RepID=A0A4W5KE52_9TELE